MKRITLLIVALLTATFSFGQSHHFFPEELEKMESVRAKQAEAVNMKKSISVPVYTEFLNANKTSKGLTYPGVIDVLILSPDEDGTEVLRAALDDYDHINATSFPLADLPALSLDDLTPYQVVLAFNNNQWLAQGGIDPDVAGDIVAEYIDGGGLFVESSYLMDYASGWEFGGAYYNGDYSAFTHATTDITGAFTLGNILEPDHPLMTDFSTLSVPDGLIQDNGLAEGAVAVAEWANGEIFAAAKTNVVSFNLLPVATGLFNFEGDGVTLYNNAIVYLMNNLADPASPAAPTALTVTAGDMGALEVSLEWTNPSETFDGETLTELDEVKVYRDGELITTITSPTIGGQETYTDSDITAAGVYSYSVAGVNSAGEGLSVAGSVYVGEDVPAAPANVTLAASGSDGQLSWDAPTEGLNGGYLSGDNITYDVVRLPDEVAVATDIVETSFLDNTVPGVGNYTYTVMAGNDIGDGGTALSNTVLLGADGLVMFEPFDYEIDMLPTGWQITGDVVHNWFVNDGANAGGTAPELMMSWTPAATGLSRLVSYPIDVTDQTELRFMFDMYLNNYDPANEGEIAAIDISYDGGTTWEEEPLWQVEITQDIGPGEFEIYFDVPADATTAHLGFRFDGNSFNINQWYFDNMIIEPVVENDLAATSIVGPNTPSVGVPVTYTVEVLNAGTLPQSDYTVKLMKGDTELDMADGTALNFTETTTFDLSWTPTEADLGDGEIYGMVDLATDEATGNNMTDPLAVSVQSSDISAISVGDGTEEEYAPYNFYFDYSLSQTLYYPEEIGLGGGVLTGIQYANNFNEALMDKSITIWVGETDADDLSGGWVDPTSLQQVFQGTIDFPAGENNIFIPFDDIYVYGGGNLVIYSYKEDDDWSSGKYFYNTLEDGSARTIRDQQDGSPLDPLAPDASAATADYFPNITMFFSTAGLGGLEGTVTDGTDPVADVMVSVLGTSATTMTDADGYYIFPFLLPDTYNVEFSKFGYNSTVVSGVEVLEEDTITADATIEALDQFTVTGTVEGNDGLLIEDASVVLEGYDTYETMTDVNGEFSIPDVFVSSYDITISADGYDTFEDVVDVVDADVDVPVTLNETIISPSGLTVDVDNQVDGAALASWGLGGNDEFRFDDGVVDGQLGFQGDINSIMGHVIHNSVQINEVSWYLTDEGGPYETVRLIILGLDENGIPDRDNVLYENTSVPNVHMEWNTYELSESVTSDGVFVGLGADGFLGLAVDDGVDAPYEFIPGTQYGVFNITDPASLFTDIQDFDFPVNYLLRSYGTDFGPLSVKGNDVVSNEMQQPAPVLISNDKPFNAGTPQISGNFANKAFVGYNVFLDDTQVATEITETEYLFEDLAEGTYTVGVQSVYSTGTSEIVEADFEIVYSVEVTINVTMNTGLSPEGTEVTLTHEENDVFTYMHTVGADGVAFFPEVKKGMYTLEVFHENYHPHVETGLSIMDDMQHSVELIEIINDPFGLVVDMEGYEQGEAMFSWNNVLTSDLDEGFEGDFPPQGWTKLSPDGGTGWETVDVGTTPFPGWNGGEALAAPEGGSKMAFATYTLGGESSNDMWLVTPQITVSGESVLSFYMRYWPDTYADNVDILISTSGNTDPADFDVVVEELQFGVGSSVEWELYAYDLTEYVDAGSQVYVAFREHAEDNFNDGAVITLDNVYYGPAKSFAQPEVSELSAIHFNTERNPDYQPTPKAEKEATGYNVYLDGQMVASDVTDTQYMFEGLENGTYTAGVEAVYLSGTSNIMEIPFEMTNGVEDFFARVQIIHNSADAAVQSVDIFNGEDILLEDVEFRTATAFLDLPAEVELPLYVAPADAGFENAVGPVNVTFEADETYVVVANGIVSSDGYDPVEPFTLYPFAMARETAATATNTDLLVFHGSTDAPAVSVWARGVDNQLFDFAYGDFEGYLELPTNDYVLEVRDVSGENLVAAFDAPLSTLELDGAALTVVASGFLAPENNSDGPAFGLWVASAAGGALIELPVNTSVQGFNFADGNISMFPNPTNDVVTFQSENTIDQIMVTDMSGRVVYTSNVNDVQHQVTVDEFESGIYFVQIVNQEGTFVGKLQVQK